jgi:dTDP-4-dehydrorhamnose reductase
MKILLTGPSGQIGGALKGALAPIGEVIALDRAQLDLENLEMIDRVVDRHAPDLIVHPAAYTAVDRAQEESALAQRINGDATGALAQSAARRGIPLISYSTDYVFDGSGQLPHREDEPTSPLNAYGRSKLAGEIAIRESGAEHLILRTAWVYGQTGKNFMLTMLKLAESREEIAVVNDQFGTPSESGWIAATTRALIERGVQHANGSTRLSIPSGIVHLTPRGDTHWAGFARAIFKLKGLATHVREIPSAEYPTPAERPKNSRLDISHLESLLGHPMPHWHDILERCLNPHRTPSPTSSS